ncbi:MAG: UDP-N-acetylmuramoyl-L-alanyl-D-glutamate--2,6-diaminopimelate ligase [Alphaproteobacteria bacterium]
MTTVIDITRFAGLTADSRLVVNGGLFVAVNGAVADGRDYIEQAIVKGAAAILTDERPGVDAWRDQIEVIQVADPRSVLADLAAKFYGIRPATIALITGSSGKTSTAEFTRQIWMALGRSSASIGTLGVIAPGAINYGGLTSPDAVALAATLAELAGAGVGAVAIEASSHGLDQKRLGGIRAEIGAFTSFSRDHLDYHDDEASYLEAKLRLFSEVMAPGGFAIVSATTRCFDKVCAAARAAGHVLLTYGKGGDFLNLKSAVPDGFGLMLTVGVDGQDIKVRLDHFAGFQAENALAAAAIAIVSGAEPKDAIAAIELLAQPAGRMQRAAVTANGAPVYVDYSHKPGALEAALVSLKSVTPGKVSVVFGCGGDRDAGKRPMMGQIATKFADRVIVTDDNPRNEDPASIRRAIIEAAPGAEEISDRRAAIRQAVLTLSSQDALLIAGKGHERGQIVGAKTLPFDDVEEAIAAVAAIEDEGEAA